MSTHTEELARKRKLLASIDAILRSGCSYIDTVRQIEEMVATELHQMDANNDGSES